MITLSTARAAPGGRRCAAIALIAASGAAFAAAAEVPRDLTALPFEQLLSIEVFSASKFAQPSSQAPALVTVITGADIGSFGWRSLGDVARSVRGLYVSYDRNYSYLGARGFLRPGDYNTRFLLLVDGNRINDAVYDQAPLGGEFPVELDLIERIEFVPGPGSSVYGSNAFFGVINVITKKSADLRGVRMAAEAGSAGARKVNASRAWRSGDGAEFVVAASAHNTDGARLYYPEFDTPDQNSGLAEGVDYERGERLQASAVSGPFHLSVTHARRLKGVPTASFFQRFNDPRSNTTDRQSYLSAAWRPVGSAPEQLSARLFAGRYDSFGSYVEAQAPYSLNRDGSASRWWGAELSLVSTRFAGHTVVAGLDYQNDYQLRQYNYNQAPYFSYLDDNRRARRAGAYLQDDVALTPHVRLNLGLRYDKSNNTAGVISPRAALIVSATPATTLKAIYGTAFRAPNAFERYYAFPGPGGQLPSPDLAKESIRSIELALVYQLGDSARLTATVFNNRVTGLITQTADPERQETHFVNAARTRFRGAELEYEQRWRRGAMLRASYSYSPTGQELGVSAPSHLAKANFAAPLAFGWRGAIEAQYVGARSTLSGAAGSYWLANTNLVNADLFNNTEVSIGIYNLFNGRHADPGSTEHLQRAIHQDGRTLRAKIGYVF